MATDKETATTLATEARRARLLQKAAQHRAAADVTAALAAHVSQLNQAAIDRHNVAQTELATLGDNPLNNYGSRSKIDDRLRAEREKGKAALVAFVRANPECEEKDALQAYKSAVGDDAVQNPRALLLLYRAQLVEAGVMTARDGWANHRAWILGAPESQSVGGEA